jgi:hypothetical protein
VDYLGELKEPNQGDLNEVVDRDLQQTPDRADLGFAASLTGRLFLRGGGLRVRPGGIGPQIVGAAGVQHALVGEALGMLDLARQSEVGHPARFT